LDQNLNSEIIAPDTLFNLASLSADQQIRAISNAQTSLRKKIKNLEGQEAYVNSIDFDMDRYLIEFHRKFALTIAIIVLFFVGAPLGAIVKKGGFGAPVVIAALLFMVYFVLMTIGENMASSKSISPLIGMWFPTMLLAPIAIWLMRAAANDSPVFSISRLRKLIQKKK
jgi:lipopolysaccharide export system permease protein